MDRIFKRYTIIAWFFTLYIAWDILTDISSAAIGDSPFSLSYGLHRHLTSSFLHWKNILGLFGFAASVAWLVMMALLVWTVRLDYLTRHPHPVITKPDDAKEAPNA